MAEVVGVTIRKQIPRGDRVRVKAIITVEDNDGVQHEIASNHTWFAEGVDVETLLAQQTLERCKDKEEMEYLQVIRRGGNPFDQAHPPKFNGYTTLLQKIIKDVLAKDDPLDPLVYNGHALLGLMDDTRIKQLFPNVTDEKIAQMRASSQRISKARVELDAHVAVEI